MAEISNDVLIRTKVGINGKIYQACKYTVGCSPCIGSSSYDLCKQLPCEPQEREDGQQVIFKQCVRL